MAGWLLIIPPITPARESPYIGTEGRPAQVEIADPLFQWTVYGRYPSAVECDRMKAKLRTRSLQLDPANATAVAYSFAKCVEDSDPRLQPNGSVAP